MWEVQGNNSYLREQLKITWNRGYGIKGDVEKEIKENFKCGIFVFVYLHYLQRHGSFGIVK